MIFILIRTSNERIYIILDFLWTFLVPRGIPMWFRHQRLCLHSRLQGRASLYLEAMRGPDRVCWRIYFFDHVLIENYMGDSYNNTNRPPTLKVISPNPETLIRRGKGS